MRNIQRIIVHCSDTEGGDAESIRKYHVSHNGWDDIGYHYVITKEGVIERGRPEERSGAHCKGANFDSLGVCLIGKHDFSETQFESLRYLVSALKKRHGPITVWPHNAFSSAKKQGKTCPNFDVNEALKED